MCADRILDDEYAVRFKARVIVRLTGVDSIWTVGQACDAADAEWEACTPDAHREMFEDDPEGSADEAISNWSD